jgi:hypothetical protein
MHDVSNYFHFVKGLINHKKGLQLLVSNNNSLKWALKGFKNRSFFVNDNSRKNVAVCQLIQLIPFNIL